MKRLIPGERILWLETQMALDNASGLQCSDWYPERENYLDFGDCNQVRFDTQLWISGLGAASVGIVWERATQLENPDQFKKFFDTLDHKQLREFLALRMRDGVLTRLIGKWLNAGVMEAGAVALTELGTPQGGGPAWARRRAKTRLHFLQIFTYTMCLINGLRRKFDPASRVRRN